MMKNDRMKKTILFIKCSLKVHDIDSKNMSVIVKQEENNHNKITEIPK